MASEDELGISQRAKGRSAFTRRRGFGESQYLRQVVVDKVRDTISGESDEVEERPASALQTSCDAAEDQSLGSRKPQQELKGGGGDSTTTTSGAIRMPSPRGAAAAADATNDTPPASASSMNVQLWELEENVPAADCDTAKPPSEENHVVTAHDVEGPPPFSRDALTKILMSKHTIDKRSLLEYSLYKGKVEHFEHLACWIRWKLGISGLVSQLREPGVNGAPLLFQAATTLACFEAAKKEIKVTLGVGGLTQQVRATDQQGMNLLMYAARHANSAEVFLRAMELVNSLTNQDMAEGLGQRDKNNMNLLHHGAEGCAEEMLSKVIDVIKDVRIDAKGDTVDLLQHLTHPTDMNEDRGMRSPDLCALGRKWTTDELLGKKGVDRMDIQREATDAFEEFMCAARGGEEAFKYVCQRHKQSVEADHGRRSSPPGSAESKRGETAGWLLAALDLESFPVTAGAEEKYTLLLAQAALGGDVAVLQKITTALCENGVTAADQAKKLARKTDYPMEESDFLRFVRRAQAARSLGEDTGDVGDGRSSLKASLFALTVLSGKTKAVEWASGFVTRSMNDNGQAWLLLSGWPLTLAVFASGKGEDVFGAVCGALRKAAIELKPDAKEADELFREALVGEPPSTSRFTPFAVAAFSESYAMVDRVEQAYRMGADACPGGSNGKREGRKNIDIRDVVAHVKAVFRMKDGPKPDPKVALLLRSCRGTGAVRGLLEAVGDEEFNDAKLRHERAELKRSVSEAWKDASDGAFEGLRALVEKGWDCHGSLSTLIKNIGDFEESVIDIVLCAIENATNPFVTAAIASKEIWDRHRYTPRDRNGLANLQQGIDVLTAEILDKLPQTVRGVGLELAGSYLDNDKYSDQKKAMLATLAGYIAVRWMLEPSLHEMPKENKMFSSSDIDPLEQALNRGSAASAFINSPLVLDYMELKWTCTVPSWSRRNPFDYAINAGFYTYGSKSKTGSALLDMCESCQEGLLGFGILEGWDLGRPVPSPCPIQPEGSSQAEGSPTRRNGSPQDEERSLWRGFPRTTVLPGLQFILAGVIGKPDQFFLIPFVRFFFATTSYLCMLALYCSCVTIETSSEIPANEALFYVFVAGLLWREVNEFRDVLPPLDLSEKEDKTGRSVHRATSAIRGYFATDNWNILDTASILCVLIAFIFRMIAFAKDLYTEDTIFNNAFTQEALFIARFALAAIAPLLFARVLSLAQVDSVLGPMTQIIWAMLFHLFRFSIFMLVVMVSFALAFHSLFSYPNCGEGDELYETYRTLHESLLQMFEAMLGDPSFENFEPARNEGCTGPSWEFDAGILLLVGYMLIMAILMLNLLIAVLSTAHDAVIGNAMTEFHLGRSQTIQASAHGIEKGRLPPPLNILMGMIFVGIDLVGEIIYQFRRCGLSPTAEDGVRGGESGDAGGEGGGGRGGGGEYGAGEAPSHEPNNGTQMVDTGSPAAIPSRSGANGDFKPLSQHQQALAIGGALERLLFACTMGLVALALSAALWVVSIPSLAGRIVRWMHWMSMPAKEKDDPSSRATGYFRGLFSGILGLLALVIGLPVAVVFCSFCIASSIAVWFRGVYGLLEWYTAAKQTESLSVFGKGAVMPGADKQVWEDAADTVEANNFGPTERKKEALPSSSIDQDDLRHFDVGALLNMTTGWSIGHLSALVSRKDKESRKEEVMLRDIDEAKRRRGKARHREEVKHRDEERQFLLRIG